MSGCTVFSDMKLAALDIGLAGMEQLQNNFASVVFYIMSIQGHAIGQIM